MSLYTVCFSPTGGTRNVVDVLAGAWDGPTKDVDLSDALADFAGRSFDAQDVCLVAVPSFGGRVPAVALERLSRLSGGGAAAVLVAVYGNRAFDDTLLELAKATRACGFRVVAAVAAVAEHSIMHQFGTGRPDKQDERELRAFGERIATALRAGVLPAELDVPGSVPYRAYGGVPFTPKANVACTKCGLCAERCPVGAIPADDPARTDKDCCISCMRCVALCPAGARTLNRVLLTASGVMMKKVCSGRKENELFLAEEQA